MPNAIALFQLRGLEETGAPEAEAVSVEFARYFIPGGRTESSFAEAAKIAAKSPAMMKLAKGILRLLVQGLSL